MKAEIMGKGKHRKILEYRQTIEQLIQQGLEKKEKTVKQIESTKKLMIAARKKGLDISLPKKHLKKAQDILDGAEEIREYDEAMKYAKKAGKIITEMQKQHKQTKINISSAIEKISLMGKKGINIKESQNLIKEAMKAFRKKDYKIAGELASKAMGYIDVIEQNYTQASDLIKKAYSKIEDAKSIEGDTTESEELLNEAQSRLEKEEYDAAKNLANKSIKAAVEAGNEKLVLFKKQTSGVVPELEQSIMDAEKLGADVKKSLAFFKKIQTALKNNDFKVTFDNIELCKNAVNESKSQHQIAMDKIHSAYGFITEAEAQGADIRKPKQIISRAEEALKLYDYKIVETQANLAIEEAERIRGVQRQLLGMREQAEDLIKAVESAIKEASDSGIIISESEKLLSKAKTALENSDYYLAQEHAKDALKNSKDVQKLHARAKEHLLNAETSINNSKMLIDTKEAEEKLEQSRLKIDAGNYSEASKLAIQIVDNLDAVKKAGKPVLNINSSKMPTFKSGTWAKCQLEVTNNGDVHSNDIKLIIPEEIESRGFLTLQDLKAGETKMLDLGIRTYEIGEIPINIGISYINPITDEHFEDQEVVWIKTEPGEMGVEVKPEKPLEDAIRKREPEGTVNVLSEIEFFQGYVRMKVGIKNDMYTVITDAKFDLEFDHNALRMDFIEPELEQKGNKVIFGVIHPKEKRTVAIYFDPQICTESNIDGTLTFMDIYGELKTQNMKRRRAEIVCPIFYTPENINTAMLKRLIKEELTIHDNKIYEIPPGLNHERASQICKDTVHGHDLKLVRSFEEHDAIDPEIETWFYGMTKVKKNKVVIKASSRKKTNTIELFVACKDKQVLTGFLAELGHNLNDKLKELGVIEKQLYPTVDASKREEIAHTNTLLNHQFPDKTILSISKRGNEYEVGFKSSETKGEAAELFEFIKVSPDTRKDILNQISRVVSVLNIFACTRGGNGEEQPSKDLNNKDKKKLILEEKIRDLTSLGKLLYGMFLPVPIQKHMESINEPMILKTNDNEMPWELLHDDSDFLCLKVPIGRRLRSREISRTNPVTKTDKTKLLFIVNATGDLAAAEDEVEYIQKHLSSEIEVEILKREAATNASILSALRSGDYDIIHYAGHAEFNSISPDESALISAGRSKIYAQEIKRILGGKPFVFLNACSSGKEKICEKGEGYTGSDTEGLASSFILGGAVAFIGASWPMPDISAGILASEFYKQVLMGDSIGEALRKARLHLKSTRPDDINWMAFMLYGDPTLKLAK
jgi:hypothetical protein